MSKVLIVGHQYSNYQKLEEILNFCGMAKALPSKAYSMTPQDINIKIGSVAISVPQKVLSTRQQRSAASRLSKNQKTLVVRHAQSESAYVQKKPKKMWDSLAFDLIMANDEQSLWGWADSNAISLLEYWADFDEDMVFVLTYDKPDVILKHLLNDVEVQQLEQSVIDEKTKDWFEYNQALINFYQKNKNRCLLVNGEQVLDSAKDYVHSVAKITQIEFSSGSEELPTLQDDVSLADSLTLDFLIREVLASSDDIHQMFNRLQNLADIPLVSQAQIGSALDLLKETVSKQNKLLQMDAEQEIQSKLMISQQENSLMIEQLHQTQAELEKYYLENKKSSDLLRQEQEKVKSLEKQLTNKQELLNANQLSPQIKQENDLLIKQLHQTQEELERYYLENQRLKSQKQEPAKPVYYGAADRVKEDLPYRLGATMVSHSKSAKDLAILPLALAKEYREFQKHQPTDLPAIEEYQDAHEAEKAKKHLSYRLGKTLVDGVKSKKVLDLPVKMGREIVGFGNK
ncbi:hypothetical protein [Moraxella equi]|uniref:Uncharacterized protein n=1 Tax=Moraxella equi TaxID=60442 RepID=A0A378QSG8_9GAMM|nr:hypothetical protein [Moraxella equi]OPH35273.1 hypothetical protein B5J93_11165 [Moraxella equi]STZ03836.1 Uncharacterised protein [Moraxella equi]